MRVPCPTPLLVLLTLAGGACQGPAATAPPIDAGLEVPPGVDAQAGEAGETTLASNPCPESPAARQPGGAVVAIPVALRFGGKVMRFGEENTVADGVTVTPLNVRFYLSNIALWKTGSAVTVPADVVTAAGALAPYGVYFFNGEDAASQVLRLRAPAGSYDGLAFSFGLADDCNAGPPERNPPLSAASQMTWPHGFGYLFFRYEARVTGAGDGGAPAGALTAFPAAIHMGGWPHVVLAPAANAPGGLTVPAASATTPARTLFLVMEEVFLGAESPTKSELPIPPPGVESALGESLRQTANVLKLFVLAP